MSRKFIANSKEEIIKVIDSETGEIVEENNTTMKTSIIPLEGRSFYLTFLENIGKLKDSTNRIDRVVIDLLMKYCEFDNNLINVTSFLKDKICSEADINPQTFANTISKLKKEAILFSVYSESGKLRRGTYRINPELVWKGSLKENARFLKIYYETLTENPNNNN